MAGSPAVAFMSFLDTVPAAIQRLDGRGPWGRFRVTEPRQRAAMLREVKRGDVPLTLGSADGPALPSLLWAVDDAANRLHLRLGPDVDAGLLRAVLAEPQLWAAGYLHEAKLQFDLPGLTLGPANPVRMLQCELPQRMVHLPRRRALRVRRADAHAPQVRFHHPWVPGDELRLSVADISMTGVALWKPAGTPLLAPGTELIGVQVALEDETFFLADMQVLHITPAGRSRGLRVGCDWRGMEPSAAEMLQAWITRGRRRRDLVSLSFD